MFAAEADLDLASRRTTRRVFVGGAVAGMAAAAALWVWRAPGEEASTDVHGTLGQVQIVPFDDDGVRGHEVTLAKIVKTDGEWYRQMGKNSFAIARQADTEMAYTGVSWREHRHGLYRCVGCETALFSSAAKFDSGTGWPSFWDVLAPQNVVKATDTSMGMERTEVKCARCESHLGHVFPDGPQPTGLRYCMNSAAMRFRPA